MIVNSTSKSRLRIGDHVAWVSAAGDEFPAAGIIVAIRRQDRAPEDDSQYVVQVTPNVLGIYQAEELIHTGREQPEALWEMLVP